MESIPLSDKGKTNIPLPRIIMAFIGSACFVFFLIVVYNDFYNQPVIVLEAARAEVTQDGVATTFIIRNEGRAPGHQVRLTASADDRIMDYRVTYNDEETHLQNISSTSIVATMPRLSANAEVRVFASVNATEKDSLFRVSLTSDEYSTKYVYRVSEPVLEAETTLSISLVVAAIALTSAAISFLVSVRPDPFGTIKTDKGEYRASDTIKIHGRVKGARKGMPLLTRVVGPSGTLVRAEQIALSDDGAFEFHLPAAGAFMTVEGIYSVIANYRQAEKATRFKYVM